ncbi:MAG: hypothetical protein BGO29_07395 [Bacteroidales bacterium 36-12]|nr:MAG: hypothetical protein BGO29_07395 [Bacteroidales bacterium 36-12]
MINHEDIFQAIQREDWGFLTSVLHKNSKDIITDTLLSQAAKTFVSEFLRQIDKYPEDKLEITQNLETLWLLDKGRFYRLTDEELKIVTCQIVKRKRDKIIEAYNFAKEYPDELICKEVIELHEKNNTTKNSTFSISKNFSDRNERSFRC